MKTFRIQEMAKPYLEYDMIRSHTELPDFPEFRTRLLYAFLNRDEKLAQRSELYSLATSLMQMALDTHDLVPESNALKEKPAARARQFKVLAGDYFSSRFYDLLSQAGQIEMIKLLSAAICEVNRLKMNLYMLMKQLKMTSDEYFQHTVNIKMQLFLTFTKMMQGVHSRLWPELLQSLTKCEVLVQELFRLESPRHFHGGWAFWELMQIGTKEEKRQLQSDEPEQGKLSALLDKYRIGAELYAMLESQLQHLKTIIRNIDGDKPDYELSQLRDMLSRYLSKPPVLKEM